MLLNFFSILHSVLLIVSFFRHKILAKVQGKELVLRFKLACQRSQGRLVAGNVQIIIEQTQ
ncbi:hypothetical protein SDC9_50670 [bioreactor metagenome]|uniref:Uncharacterized protein n=1 Tax=bioreactor metagenome TaxID=1076179 RepID=A0A644WQ17_9ZZZZ